MKTEFKKNFAILSILALILFISSCKKHGGDWEGNAPNKVFLSRITISDYPETRQDNMPWDLNSPPDIHLFIQDETGEFVIDIAKTDTIADAKPDTSYIFDLSPPVEILNPEIAHRVQIHDIDYTVLKYETMYDNTNLSFFKLHSRSPFHSDTTIASYYNLSSGTFKVKFDVLYEY